MTSYELLNGSICLRAHTPPNTPVVLTAQFGISYTNFTLLHKYTAAEGDTVTLEHYVCDAVCGVSCNALGTTNYTSWTNVLNAQPDACFASFTEDGLHGAHDPYIHQSFNGFGQYAVTHPGVFPESVPLTSLAPPTLPHSTSSENNYVTQILLAGFGSLLLVGFLVAFLSRPKNAVQTQQVKSYISFDTKRKGPPSIVWA